MRNRLSENCPGRLVNGRPLQEPQAMPEYKSHKSIIKSTECTRNEIDSPSPSARTNDQQINPDQQSFDLCNSTLKLLGNRSRALKSSRVGNQRVKILPEQNKEAGRRTLYNFANASARSRFDSEKKDAKPKEIEIISPFLIQENEKNQFLPEELSPVLHHARYYSNTLQQTRYNQSKSLRATESESQRISITGIEKTHSKLYQAKK